jgi:hypothetical protein
MDWPPEYADVSWKQDAELLINEGKGQHVTQVL